MDQDTQQQNSTTYACKWLAYVKEKKISLLPVTPEVQSTEDRKRNVLERSTDRAFFFFPLEETTLENSSRKK